MQTDTEEMESRPRLIELAGDAIKRERDHFSDCCCSDCLAKVEEDAWRYGI
jgi:hypothetical protein